MFGTFAGTRMTCRAAVTEALAAVNSVCPAWWKVLTGRTANKRRLRTLLGRKSSSYDDDDDEIAYFTVR